MGKLWSSYECPGNHNSSDNTDTSHQDTRVPIMTHPHPTLSLPSLIYFNFQWCRIGQNILHAIFSFPSLWFPSTLIGRDFSIFSFFNGKKPIYLQRMKSTIFSIIPLLDLYEMDWVPLITEGVGCIEPKHTIIISLLGRLWKLSVLCGLSLLLCWKVLN